MNTDLSRTAERILRAMGTICHNRRCTSHDIAQHTNRHASTLGAGLLELMREELIERDDAKTFFPTPKGWALLEGEEPSQQPTGGDLPVYGVVARNEPGVRHFGSLEVAEKQADIWSYRGGTTTVFELEGRAAVSRWLRGKRMAPDA